MNLSLNDYLILIIRFLKENILESIVNLYECLVIYKLFR